jgi:hypothetical protein
MPGRGNLKLQLTPGLAEMQMLFTKYIIARPGRHAVIKPVTIVVEGYKAV